MVLRLEKKELRIEDVRNHPADAVENLRHLLEDGTEARPDPHRSNFFEIPNSHWVYYVHVCPENCKVLLLGMWPKTEGKAS